MNFARRGRRGFLAAIGLTVACAGPARSQEGYEPPGEPMPPEAPAPDPLMAPQARFENVTVILEVARTDAQRQKGLGGHAPLGETDGMLFVFERPAFYSFWMKGMLFPLDLIWIENGVVVHVEPNAPHHTPETPDAQLPIYVPAAMATYVLEVNAGFTALHGIVAGTPVSLLGV